jgi:hypothetical protein
VRAGAHRCVSFQGGTPSSFFPKLQLFAKCRKLRLLDVYSVIFLDIAQRLTLFVRESASRLNDRRIPANFGTVSPDKRS